MSKPKKCTAIAQRTGVRCRNDAEVDIDGDGVLDACRYANHQDQVRDRKADRVELVAPASSGGLTETQGYGESLTPSSTLPEELEPPRVGTAAAADSPTIAQLQQLSDTLFQDEPIAAPAAGNGRVDTPLPRTDAPPSPAAGAAALRGGRWTPDRVRQWVKPGAHAFNDWLEDRGLDRSEHVDGEDIDFLSEAWAPAFEDFMSRVDPNNPYGAAFLSTAIVLGPKVFKAMRRRREPPAPRTPRRDLSPAAPRSALMDDLTA